MAPSEGFTANNRITSREPDIDTVYASYNNSCILSEQTYSMWNNPNMLAFIHHAVSLQTLNISQQTYNFPLDKFLVFFIIAWRH